MPRRQLVLVLVVDGSPRLAAPILAERFAHVRCETGAVLVTVGRPETPESVLAYCRERRIGVQASCVVSRSVPPPVSTPQEVSR